MRPCSPFVVRLNTYASSFQCWIHYCGKVLLYESSTSSFCVFLRNSWTERAFLSVWGCLWNGWFHPSVWESSHSHLFKAMCQVHPLTLLRGATTAPSLLPRKLFTLESWAKKQNKNLYLREKRRVNGPSHTNFFSHKLVHSSLYSLRICNSEGIKPRRMHAHNIQFWYKAGFCAVSLPWNTEKMIKEKL